MNSFFQLSLASSQVIHVSINCYQYLMRCITLWLKVMKFVVYFLAYRNRFDEVWYEGLAFKLKQNEISGNLPNIFDDI